MSKFAPAITSPCKVAGACGGSESRPSSLLSGNHHSLFVGADLVLFVTPCKLHHAQRAVAAHRVW